MAFFIDGTTYNYMRTYRAAPPVNIGWLDKSVKFPVGLPPTGLVDKLMLYVPYRRNKARGGHGCNLSHGRPGNARHQMRSGLGTAEIWVASYDGTIFACPDLVIDYIMIHHYSPPYCFVDAVLNGPAPGSPEYTE